MCVNVAQWMGLGSDTGDPEVGTISPHQEQEPPQGQEPIRDRLRSRPGDHWLRSRLGYRRDDIQLRHTLSGTHSKSLWGTHCQEHTQNHSQEHTQQQAGRQTTWEQPHQQCQLTWDQLQQEAGRQPTLRQTRKQEWCRPGSETGLTWADSVRLGVSWFWVSLGVSWFWVRFGVSWFWVRFGVNWLRERLRNKRDIPLRPALSWWTDSLTDNRKKNYLTCLSI